MEKVDVKIDKAQIKNFNVELREDEPYIGVTIDLFAHEKKIADFYMATSSYGNNKFEVTPVLAEPIMRIAKELERIVVDRYNKQLLLSD